MKMVKLLGVWVKLIGVMLNTIAILAICAPILYVAHKGNQPMQVVQAPKGMTYFEFIADRVDAAKTVQPSQCGWGMFATLAVLGPIYSVIYTEIGLHPDGLLARGATPDPDIPKNVANAPWYEVPNIWWNTVEKLSWTMLGRQANYGCKFRPVLQVSFD